MRSCLILGSGRSGTSMLAGVCAGAGYYMGTQLWPARDGNPKGFFEDREVNLINEDLLRLMSPAGVRERLARLRGPRVRLDGWLADVPLVAALRPPGAALERRIAAHASRTPYCFKDPRFCYTLPYWRPFLHDESVFLCVFREPGRTVQSILKECATVPYLHGVSMTPERAYAVWTSMYRHVLERHSSVGRWVFLHFDQLLDGSALVRVEEALEAHIDREFPERDFKRSPDRDDAPSDTRQVYARLCELAGMSERPA